MIREHLIQELPLAPIYNPFFCPKTSSGESKNIPPNYFRVFVKRPIKPLGKIFWTQKTDRENHFSSRSYKRLKFEFVCSRIIILILLKGFHKFARSRGLNSSDEGELKEPSSFCWTIMWTSPNLAFPTSGCRLFWAFLWRKGSGQGGCGDISGAPVYQPHPS